MAKRIYVGVANKARKVAKAYVGVNGVARKIKKAYIGIGGVARPCFSSGFLEYYGQITPLSMPRALCAVGSVLDNTYWYKSSRAIIAGGRDAAVSRKNIDAYDISLTRTTGTLSSAITAKGDSQQGRMVYVYPVSPSTFVHTLDASLTEATIASKLNTAIYYPSIVSLFNTTQGYPQNITYVAGGYTSGGYGSESAWAIGPTGTTVDLDNIHGTMSGVNMMSAKASDEMAIFAGGTSQVATYTWAVPDAFCTAYKSTTRIDLAALSVARSQGRGASLYSKSTNASYAIIAGGYRGASSSGSWEASDYNTVDAYDASGTKVVAPSLSKACRGGASVSFLSRSGGYTDANTAGVLFVGGSANICEGFMEGLTHIIADIITPAVHDDIGDHLALLCDDSAGYILQPGGRNTQDGSPLYTDTVDVIQFY